MKYTIFPIITVCLSLAGVALADDAPSAPPVKSQKQKMHECMAQERATNSAMSEQDMKKACTQKLQSDENHPSRPQSSPDPNHS
jgi:pentapeptide MXKDX repeat protein